MTPSHAEVLAAMPEGVTGIHGREALASFVLQVIHALKEKRAPVQGYSAGIPWSMHLRAYDAYCKKYGAQPALIDLEGRNCRGGFGVSELDKFIPGWRDELSRIKQLETALHDIASGNLHVTDAMLASREAMMSALANYCQNRAREVIGQG
jgi:hypothetical protein